ncbi:T9SS type A sorting domain-containing protein [Flavobacterium collinsii]|uniref:Secretion system C-terminal sorting domain-containing protein n=1 Tax=Flavobacterium collinsii TaxID=1114861 RepID=A0A9W4TLI8_9FLAO|nr:T9SS type A sorting domain-containing protein [Flavobacterium collinsii]CAI2768200.1 conserved protein of unknown function precursor containing a type A C-terminal secretion signal [Flavobacterium collinsii]
MKKIIRSGIYLLVFLAGINCFSQKSIKSSTELKTAKLQLIAGSKQYNPKAALVIFERQASEGNAEAMNGLGLIYSQGLGVAVNESLSLEWFQKAAQNGYPKAYYNLAMHFKNGIGVAKDEVKALDYFEKAVNTGYTYAYFSWGQMISKGLGSPQNYALAMHIWKQGADLGIQDCIYGLGYLHYKGFGTEQDYQKAFILFQLAADKGGSAGMYMLGICYRNGYGINIDNQKARYWLTQSAALGYKNAAIELGQAQPENAMPNQINTQSVALETINTLNEGTAPKKFQKVNQKAIQGDISGIYTGYLIRYDWSGQNIISKTPLEVTLNKKGEILEGEWKEKEGDQAHFQANITPEALIFKNSKIDRIEHFSNNTPKTYEFKQAKLQYLQKDDMVYIAGNIQLYDLKEHEIEKPIYVSLQRNASFEDTGGKQIISQVIIYPNPVTANSFNLSYELTEPTDISIEIYSFTGFLVSEQKLKTIQEGLQQQNIQFNGPSGNYILNLHYGTKVIKTILIKK